jgi:hypothetical protein
MKTTAKSLGYLSIATNILFWIMILNPFGTKGFAGDVMFAGLITFGGLLSSLIACISSRWWGINVVISLADVVIFELGLK